MRKLNKRKLNKPRSKQAIASDLSKRAKKTLKNTKKNVKIWKKNPRRIDIEGVDTPKRKVKRTSKPKTVRSKVVKKVKPKTVKKVKPKTVKKVKPKTVKKVKPKTVKKVKPKTVKKGKPVIKGKVINTKKVNSSIRQKKPKERKSTMELIELKQELESVYLDVVQKHKEYKNSEDGTDKQYAAMQKFNNAVERRDKLRMKIREIETGVEQTMGGGYEGITAKDIDTTPLKRDPVHEKRIRDTDEWQRKHDSD